MFAVSLLALDAFGYFFTPVMRIPPTANRVVQPPFGQVLQKDWSSAAAPSQGSRLLGLPVAAVGAVAIAALAGRISSRRVSILMIDTVGPQTEDQEALISFHGKGNGQDFRAYQGFLSTEFNQVLGDAADDFWNAVRAAAQSSPRGSG